jgi:hypothetical protein
MWMGAPMKTTIDLAEPLLHDARELAHRERTTLRALMEEALSRLLAERARSRLYTLEDHSFPPAGSGEGAQTTSWEETRSLIYEGRGG